MLTSVAISCGVPTRMPPPLPTYGPSVPSRTTTKSTSPGSASGLIDAGQQRGGAEVDVVVEREAELEQQAALDVGADQPRVARHSADGAQQDDVVRGDGRQLVVGQHIAGRQVARGTELRTR